MCAHGYINYSFVGLSGIIFNDLFFAYIMSLLYFLW
uniref:Uncharacterized protein n=1 Tax=Rhizophora mucronata TaxID=61149 RepID=A0A2P2J3Z9_RHIMU